MNSYSQIFIIGVILIFLLKLYLVRRQSRAIVSNFNDVPSDFAQTITKDQHQKAACYNLAKLKLTNTESVISLLVLLVFTLGGGIQFINSCSLQLLSTYPLTQGVLVIVVFTLINAVITLPISIYGTFHIEQKFGFNNTSVKLFILDTLKNLVLALTIGVPFLYLILWLMVIMGNFWWLWVWSAFILFNLLLLVIYPAFIAPLFNKFTPLADGELKERINLLLDKCGFKSRGVFIMDGSRRSTHGNAYFTGIGKAKRIVFFDTLIKQLSISEIEAVLAHELGHFKLKHIVKQIILSFVVSLFTLFVLSLMLNARQFYVAMGVTTMSNANALLLFSLLLSIVSVPLTPFTNYLSRKNEFEADEFASRRTHKNDLIKGLVKLYRDNAVTLTPDKWYAVFYYSHPPASVRIAALQSKSGLT